MKPTGDDAGQQRSYRQVARRYAEGEMLAQRQELAALREERARLRAALARIAAEPDPDGDSAAGEAIARLRVTAREALSREGGA